MTVIAQGAEAVLRKEDGLVVKERIAKNYRHPRIDESLRKYRTRREAKILQRLEELGFPSPRLHDSDDKKMTIVMDFLEGPKVRDVLSENPSKFGAEIGKKVGILHANDIVHHDLTTSNMILEDEIFFIDFGLASFADHDEPKAVDLHVFDEALGSTHHEVYEEVMDAFFKAYEEGNPDGHQAVLKRLDKVSKRGRNKKK